MGNFSKNVATIILPNSPILLGNFCKGVKIFHFSSEILFGQILLTFGNFFLVTLMMRHCPNSCLSERKDYCTYVSSLLRFMMGKSLEVEDVSSKDYWPTVTSFFDTWIVPFTAVGDVKLMQLSRQELDSTKATIFNQIWKKIVVFGTHERIMGDPTNFVVSFDAGRFRERRVMPNLPNWSGKLTRFFKDLESFFTHGSSLAYLNKIKWKLWSLSLPEAVNS